MAATAQEKGKMYMVAGSHLDTQWNWDIQATLNENLRNTVTQNLYLLDRYPDYVFNYEGGVKYAWMKEYFPNDYKRVADYIKQGRWHISGASWDANDPNIPSVESFIHSILLAQNLYKKEFGVTSTDIYLPDCFGFPYTLPTIAAHCGLIGFSTTKLEWRRNPFYPDGSKIPFHFGHWQGIDGARILAAPDGHGYIKWYSENFASDPELLGIIAKSPINKGFRYYGAGDWGGSASVETIEALEKSIHEGGALEIISATSDQLFKEYLPLSGHDELPLFDGELLMDIHATGCYTSQAAMKLYNRRNEQLIDAAEKASVAADWLGVLAYPHERIDEIWKRFLWHQFHDDLTGTSIPRAYAFSWNDELLSLSQSEDAVAVASQAVAKHLHTQVKGTPLVVYNPVASEAPTRVVARVTMPSDTKGVSVYDANGEKMPSQWLGYEKGKALIAFNAPLVPMGWCVFDVRASQPQKSTALSHGERSIENRIYKVTLNQNGDICSLIDKRVHKELVQPGRYFGLALFTDNRSTSFPAWEIMKEVMDKEPIAIGEGKARISLYEDGASSVALQVVRYHNNSRFEQIIRLTDGGADDRIDIETHIDWAQEGALLKVQFPTNLTKAKARYDLGIGSIERGVNAVNKYEVPAQQWADLTQEDKTYGLAIVNNCKYGWDYPEDNNLRLTLLHTPITGRSFGYQAQQDLGHHTFTYSLIGHPNTFVEGDIVRKADAMNNPAFVYQVSKHTGPLGSSFSLFKNSTPGLYVRAFKAASDGNGYIVRAYQTSGQAQQEAQIAFTSPILSAYETNGIEENKGNVSVDHNALVFDVTPFQLRTFRVIFDKPRRSYASLAQTELALPFNDYGFTKDVFLMNADFDRKGHTYSYDLLPDTLVSGGVSFRFGPFGLKNIVRCQGQELALPQAQTDQTLCLLVASSKDDRHVEINGIPYFVPYYSDFVGQWRTQEDGRGGFMKDAEIAYVGTHRHDLHTGNEPYVFTYMFMLRIPIAAGTSSVTLPFDDNVTVFAATLIDSPTSAFSKASDTYSKPNNQ